MNFFRAFKDRRRIQLTVNPAIPGRYVFLTAETVPAVSVKKWSVK